MAARDERLDPVRLFTVSSLRVDQERWRLLEEEEQVVLSSFFNTPDYTQLFVCRAAGGGLLVSLDFPQNVPSKVVCVSKSGPEAITKENVRQVLTIQEVQGTNAKSFIMAACEEVTCPSLSNPGSRRGVAAAAVKFMQRQRYEALLLKAQVEGRTCLAYPDGLHAAVAERKLSDMKLLHACDSTIMEWAGLVSEFLQQDSSQPVLDGLEPLPSEEFHFWRTRLQNLHFLQEQLESSRAQQLLSIVQKAESIYWSTLRDIYRDVQEGLKEAEDVSLKLNPVQEKLEAVTQMEYQQLGDNMAAVMEEVRLLWISSEFYCKPCRIVTLLQEICNLFIQMSRRFLQSKDLLGVVVSDPAVGLDDVRLVISTLHSLKEAYSQSRSQLEQQQRDTQSCWDFPSHLVFYSVDNFLLHLQSIQEVFSVSQQLHNLDSRLLSGVGGRKWSAVVQEVFQDFLCHVTVLSDCHCDVTDPDDQNLQLHLDQFWVQVLDLERRLVSVLSKAFEACRASSSAAKLVKMFRFILDRPLIQDQLRPQLARLEVLVLEELDQIELQFYSQKENPQAYSRVSPTAAATLCWTQQLHLRAERTLNHYRTVQLPCLASSESLVPLRAQQVQQLLQDFRQQVRSSWSSLLDSDCKLILDQPLIHMQQGMLGVNCSHQLQVVLRTFRCVSRDRGLELLPLAAGLFLLRDDLTHRLLSLSHMESCYQQVVQDILPVELPLIHQQLLQLNKHLSHLLTHTWSSTGVQQLLQQQRDSLLLLHSKVTQARANMAAMTVITQGWAELHLLHSGDSPLEGGATEHCHARIREEGQELLRLTQVNRTLYGAEDSSESWIQYLDHIDDQVQEGLFTMLLTALRYLVEHTHPQGCNVFLKVSLQLQETGSVFEPSVGVGLSDLLQTIISNLYTAAGLPPRISESRHDTYQVSLQQSPDLSALEQEVMHHLLQVREEAERLSAGLDRFSYLWLSDRKQVMQEFLTYSRHLGPEEQEVEVNPPTLKDFQREVESLNKLSTEVTHLDDVIVLHNWLQVDLRPFKDRLLSVIQDWRHLYTTYLLESVSDSLQQLTQHGGDDEEAASSSSSFPLTGTIVLLEAAGVQLPEHLSAQLQC